jgi:hypothetical protein
MGLFLSSTRSIKMGDPRRFDLFAKFILKNFPPEKYQRVADIAGGKGYLQTALRSYGYNVTTFDKRKGRKNRPNRFQYQYRFFDHRIEEEFDLLVGMHPDEATDIIIAEAARRKTAYAIVPCCIKPTVSKMKFTNAYNYTNWIKHLKDFAKELKLTVNKAYLRMTGKRLILYGK